MGASSRRSASYRCPEDGSGFARKFVVEGKYPINDIFDWRRIFFQIPNIIFDSWIFVSWFAWIKSTWMSFHPLFIDF